MLGAGLGLTLLFHLRHAVTAHRSAGVVEDALEGLPGRGEGPRVPLAHIALPPLMFRAGHLRVERGRIYSDAGGQRLRLDVYRPKPEIPPPARIDAERRPAVIQVHGGGWLSGSRSEQGIPLLNHLAALGWVGFNIDYRLSPQATWPDQIIDVKRAIAWVRENAAELGVDPARIAITGGSAGGHLTALAGLSANDPDFPARLRAADTSLLAAVPFYGVYDLTDSAGHYYPELREWAFERIVFKRPLDEARELYERASPLHRAHADAPPFMIIHGERDTLVPVGDARDFAARLSEAERRRRALRRAARRRARLRPLALSSHGPGGGCDRALPRGGADRRPATTRAYGQCKSRPETHVAVRVAAWTRRRRSRDWSGPRRGSPSTRPSAA